MNYLALIAFSAGAAIATQSAMNAWLGKLLDNALLATAVAFSSSVVFSLLAILVSARELPSTETLRAVPFYLWFGGGMLSAFGISLMYYLIPQMGIGQMMSYALAGQLIVAMLAGHMGWFSLPVTPIDGSRLIGVVFLVAGIALLNRS